MKAGQRVYSRRSTATLRRLSGTRRLAALRMRGHSAAALFFILLVGLAGSHFSREHERALASAAATSILRVAELARRIDRALLSSPGDRARGSASRHDSRRRPGLSRGARRCSRTQGRDRGERTAAADGRRRWPRCLGAATPLGHPGREGRRDARRNRRRRRRLRGGSQSHGVARPDRAHAPLAECSRPGAKRRAIITRAARSDRSWCSAARSASTGWTPRARARERRARRSSARTSNSRSTRGRCGLWDWDLVSGARRPGRARCSRCSDCVPRRACRWRKSKTMVHPDDKPLSGLVEEALAAGEGSSRSRIPHARARRTIGSGCASAPKSSRTTDLGGRRLVGIALDVTDPSARPRFRRPPISVCARRSRRSRKPSCSGTRPTGSCSAIPNISACTICPSDAASRARPMPKLPRSAPRRSSPSQTPVNPHEPALGAERAKTYEAQTGRRALAAGQRAAHPRRRFRLRRHRHHRAEGARGATGQIRAPAAGHRLATAPVAPLARGAGATTRRSRRALSRTEGAGGNGQSRQGRISRQHEP